MKFIDSNTTSQNKPKPKLTIPKIDMNTINQVQQEVPKSRLTLTQQKSVIEHFFKDSNSIFMFSAYNNEDDWHECFYKLNVQVAEVAMRKNGRKYQEDRFLAIPLMKPLNIFMYGVFDGHGGSIVSKILSEQLHIEVNNYLINGMNYQIAIQQSFLKLNEKIINMQFEQNIDGGSTALYVVNNNNKLYICNVGDCSAFIVSNNKKIMKLTSEHRLSRGDELERVQKQGNFVLENKKQLRINGELLVSRSFGDKSHQEGGLIVDPEITEFEISHEHQLLILTTDGFWEAMQSDEILNRIEIWMNTKGSIYELSKYLIDGALEKGQHKQDNMTVMVINLQQHFL